MSSRKILYFAALQFAIFVGLIWFIAGNDRLFRSTVPIEQRLISRDESIRKRAQQELLGYETDAKKEAVRRLIPVMEADDPFGRKWAAISLALIGPAAQEAIPVLLQSVSAKEKDVAQAARVALSEIGAPDPQQLPTLLRALQDPKESVRCEAALSISKMGPAAKDAIPELMRHLNRPAEMSACFESAMASLAVSMPDFLPPVIDLLDSEDLEVRRKSAHVLAIVHVHSPEMITNLFSVLAREPDAKTRVGLARALQLAYTPEADKTDVWMSALHAEDPVVRLAAAQEVKQSAPHGKQALPFVGRMARDPDPSIRRLGLETLRRSGVHSVDMMHIVSKAQRDSDPGVRCRAAEALIEAGELDRIAPGYLIADLKKDEDTAHCAEDILSLVGLFDPTVVRSMIRLVVEDKDLDIRSRAARVLMHLGPRAHEAIPALKRAQKEEVPGAGAALKAVRLSGVSRRN